MNIAVGTANVTYLSPADLRRLVAETLAPTSSLLDLTPTSFTLKDPISLNYLVATGTGFAFDTATQTFSGGTITSIDFYQYVIVNNVMTEVPYRVVTVTGLQADAAAVYSSIFDPSILNPLFDNYAYNVLGTVEADILYGADGSLYETFDGNAGLDTLTYEDAEFGGVTVNLETGTGVKPGGGIDIILNIENLTGSAQADVLIGDAASNVLSGGEGNDSLFGNGGDDTLVGGGGNDLIDGGLGLDTAVYSGNRSDYTITQDTETGTLTVAATRGLDGTDTLLNVNRIQFADQLFLGLTTVGLLIPGLTLTGTEGDDTLTGSEGDDTIFGLGGNDTLVGGGGADTIHGGLGDDRLVGGSGAGNLFGEGGNDTLSLSANGSTAYGGEGDDYLSGTGTFSGDAGNDRIIGLAGSTILGGSGNDDIGVSLDIALVDAGVGDDSVRVSNYFFLNLNGDSYLGNSTISEFSPLGLSGGAGADVLTFSAMTSYSSVDAIVSMKEITGFERIIFDGFVAFNDSFNVALNDNNVEANGTLSIDVTNTYYAGGYGFSINGSAELDGHLNISGSVYDDVLIGGAQADTLNGGQGADTLTGGAGNDFLNGGTGIDTAVYSGSQSDYTIEQNALDARVTVTDLRGIDGSDTLTGINRLQFAGLATVDLVIPGLTLMGTEGDDTLTGDEGNDTIFGLGGNDTLFGSSGADTIFGGLGDDTLVGGTGGGALYGEDGNDNLSLSGGGSSAYGGAGYDYLVSGLGGGDLYGEDGNDWLSLSDIGSSAYGGEGDDSLSGTGTFYGDAGNDRILGINGSTIFGGAGNDDIEAAGSYVDSSALIDAGSGDDRVIFREYSTSSASFVPLNSPIISGGSGTDLLTLSFVLSYIPAYEVVLTEVTNFEKITFDIYSFTDTYFQITLKNKNVEAGGVLSIDVNELFDGSNFSFALDGSAELDGQLNISGTDGNDVLIGGAQADVLNGGAGNDFLNGGTGIDTAVYSGSQSDYTIEQNALDGRVTVTDLRGIDGSDTLTGINRLQFAGLTTFDLVIPDLTLTGTDGDDTLTGNEGDDTILGAGGNDTLFGGGGANTLDGGTGSDSVIYGEGLLDVLRPSAGYGVAVTELYFSDTLGNVRLVLSIAPNGTVTATRLAPDSTPMGIDILTAVEEIFAVLPELNGFQDQVRVEIDQAAGTLTAFRAPVLELTGTADSDYISLANELVARGLSLDDADLVIRVDGLEGDDVIDGIGVSAQLYLSGGPGEDMLTGGKNGDTFDGGAGNDVVNYSRDAQAGALQGVEVDFASGTAIDTFGSADLLLNVEDVVATDLNDTLLGTADGNFFLTNLGNDMIDGRGGYDRVEYSWFSGGIAADLAAGTIQGNGGAFLHHVQSIEAIRGTAAVDSMRGDAADNQFAGYNGADFFDGGAGQDEVRYDRDARFGGTAGVSVNLAEGWAVDGFGETDTLISIENVIGSAASDLIFGSELQNKIASRGGDDIVWAGAGDDWVDASGIGSRQIHGGAGLDSVIYGEGLLDVLRPSTSYGVAVSELSFLDSLGNVRLVLTVAPGGTVTAKQLAPDGSVLGIDSLTAVEAVFAVLPELNGFQDQVRVEIDQAAGTLTAFRAPVLDLTGTAESDYISVAWELQARGLSLDDPDLLTRVDGLAGRDTIDGSGVLAQLHLLGGTENDSLSGGRGNDTVTGGDGQDYLFGGNGDDIIDSSGGSAASQGFGDVINPGLGSNTIIGNAAAYAIFLGGIELRYDDVGPVGGITVLANADGSGTVVSGQVGLINDTFTYADSFVGTSEDDAFYGGTAQEESFAGGAGNDYINGGSLTDSSNDYAFYGSETGGVGITADLRIGQVVDTYGYTDTLVNIEGIDGSQYDDLIIGNSGNNALYGYDGVDTIIGGSGDDYLDGGRGDDTLRGEGGDDRFSGLAGEDTIDGGAGRDEVRYDRDARKGGTAGVSVNLAEGWAVDGFGQTDTLISIEDVKGTDSNDLIIGSALQNNISTLGGDDVVAAGAGDDWIEIVGNGSNEVDGEEGFDTVSYGEYAIDAFLSSVGYGVPSEVIRLSDLSGMTILTVSFAADGALEVVRLSSDGSVLGVDRLSSVESIFAATVRLDGLQEQVRIEIDAEGRTLTAFRKVGLVLSGTEGADVITVAKELATRGIALDNPELEVFVEGLGRADVIDGSGVALAQDLFGGVGNDTIIGGDGRDFLFGGDGDDIIDSSGGSAVLQGFGDIINPGLGSNTIIGNSDAYAIFLGGIELRYAGLGLVGGITVHSGINGSGTVVSGQSGLINDTFTYADTFVGTSENDLFFGGDAQEESFGGGAGNDYINGGSASDPGMDYAAYTIELGGRGVIVDLAAGTAIDTFGDTDTLVNIEGIDGSQWDDVVRGDGFNNAFFGYEGNDTFFGGGGFDFVSSGVGDDRLDGGSDDDVIDGGLGEDTAVFSGNQSDYRIRYDQAAGSYTVSDRRLAADGRDTLTGIEYLAFADGTVATGSVTLDSGPFDGVATGDLVVSGSAAEGGVLTASVNDLVDPDGYTTLAYRWQERVGAVWTDLAGAQQSSLAIPSDQSFVGRSVRVVATSTDQYGGVTDFTSLALVIQNVNDAPVVLSPVNLGSSPEDVVKTITAAELLAGATDADGDNLTVANLAASSGSLLDNSDGTWTWTPAANDTTGMTFTYNVTDGTASVAQTATLDLTPVNDAPVVASTINLGTSPENLSKTIMASALLAGATDADGDILSVADLVASSGTLVANDNATWTWTPAANDTTGVTFTYKVTDGIASVAQTATLGLTPVNDAPIVAGAINLGTSPEDAVKTITAAALLAGATDADGDILSVIDLVVSSGTLVANNNATWTWTPAANDTTGVTFTYSVTDGTASVAQTATLDLTPVNDAPTGAVVIQGTARQGQTLTASSATIADADGLGAFAYSWYRNGGVITGAAAATYVLAAPDVGAAITARVTYTDGFGTVETLLSAATATVTSTSVPGVTITGTSRANTINGTGGDDILSGLGGNDKLNGLGGNDRLLGGDGNDLLSGGLGDDYLDGGAGTDTVTYAGQAGSVIASLAAATATGATGSDQLINVENLIGGNGNDVLTGNAGANNINGGAGDDFITGGMGNDVLAGGSNGSGGDTVNYADAIARVTVSLATTSAQNTGGAGRDTISGFENLVGSSFGDVLTGSTGNNVIRGGDGADRIIGGNGTDYLYGDAGPDTFVFTANSNSRVGIARDVIFDLEVGDVLDFSAIDANGAARGNTAFINVGQNAFTGIGQLRMYEAEGTWLVEGNTGGTLDADFQVELRNWSGQPFTDLVL